MATVRFECHECVSVCVSVSSPCDAKVTLRRSSSVFPAPSSCSFSLSFGFSIRRWRKRRSEGKSIGSFLYIIIKAVSRELETYPSPTNDVPSAELMKILSSVPGQICRLASGGKGHLLP